MLSIQNLTIVHKKDLTTLMENVSDRKSVV